MAVISFARDQYTVRESDGVVGISLVRSGNLDQHSVVMVSSRTTNTGNIYSYIYTQMHKCNYILLCIYNSISVSIVASNNIHTDHFSVCVHKFKVYTVHRNCNLLHLKVFVF